MCGITGIFAPPGQQATGLESLCRRMSGVLEHRGPDASGLWTDPEAGIGLGHRRLSILELSPLGAQPMVSASGRFVLCYNGEIYNHLTLRVELASLGHHFRGASDTETLLAACEAWGLAEALRRANGMFALALWDRQKRTLSLARDRLGKKPLYHGTAGPAVIFASELKALRAHPDFEADLDRDALALYFRLGYIPAPHSIYSQGKKLPPGSILTLSGSGAEPVLQRYWSVDETWRQGAQKPFQGGEKEAADRLEELLADAVSLRMLSDVPLGALLSGGVDSSLVVALMQRASSRPVRTFCIGFAEPKHDESGHALAVARHLGCEHTSLTLGPRDLLDLVPEVPGIWDEPFADASQIPTLLVCRLARRQVTVVLSGDGGDELFCGYERYHANAPARTSTLPAPLRALARWGGEALAPWSTPLLGPLSWKLGWRLDAMSFDGFADHYRYFTSIQRHPRRLVPGAADLPGPVDATIAQGLDRYQAMTLWDARGFLPDDILVKVDRASMAVSLEARTPLLDHRVAAFAASLPTAMKTSGGQGKVLLRRVLHRMVPPALVDRPKAGFGIPLDQWLRGPLRDWAGDLLAPERLRRDGLLNAQGVAAMWTEHQSGQANWQYHLWSLLMFQAWQDAARNTAKERG